MNNTYFGLFGFSGNDSNNVQRNRIHLSMCKKAESKYRETTDSNALNDDAKDEDGGDGDGDGEYSDNTKNDINAAMDDISRG